MTATNPSFDVHVEDVPMSTSSHDEESFLSPPLSPSHPPQALESVVPPNSPDPLWRCCARFSKMDLDGDTDAQNNSIGLGLTRADLSFLQDHNPLSGDSLAGRLVAGVARRVSDDFASNEISGTNNASSPTPSPKETTSSFPWTGDSRSSNRKINPARHGGWQSVWDNIMVRDIPIYYFFEPTSSLLLHLSAHPPQVVADRISECLRCTSVQARYFADPAAAALLTLEQVEMYLVLWIKSDQLLVELQRRRGDSSVFLRYSRLILSAAKGEFNASFQEERVRNASLNTDWQESLKSTEMVLQHACPPSTLSSSHTMDHNPKLMRTDDDSSSRSVAVVALVSNLIAKDDYDSRHLGMETACILTDPRRTGIATAVMMSRVVVLGILQGEEGETLGDVCKHIHLILLMLIMTRNFPGNNNTGTVHTNSSLFSDELEMDDFNECFFSDEEHPTEHSEFASRMFHQALQVLANSLEVLANFDKLDPSTTTSPEKFLQELVESFVAHANRLVPAESTGHNYLVQTLLKDCRMAEQQPHNAYLAAKILKYLCGASPSLVAAVLQERGLDDLTLAHQVGQRTHLCLELETEQLLALLVRTTKS